MTNNATKPAKDEVKAALLAATVHEDMQSSVLYWSPVSRSEVAVQVARARGMDGHTQSYQSTDAAVRKYVNPTHVSALLEEMVRQGEALSLTGSHELIRGRRYVRNGGTYFLAPRAHELMVAEASAKWTAARDSRADKYALDKLKAVYPKAYAALVTEYNGTQAEPDWTSMLEATT